MSFHIASVVPGSWVDLALQFDPVTRRYDPTSVRDENAKTIFNALERYQKRKETLWACLGFGALFFSLISYHGLKYVRVKEQIRRYTPCCGLFFISVCFHLALRGGEDVNKRNHRDPTLKSKLIELVKKGYCADLVSAAGVFNIDLSTAANI